MTRRIGLATVYTLFVATLLSTWPRWATHPPLIEGETVITSVPMARWLLILIPLYWGWVAFNLQTRRARALGVIASAVLFVACLLLVAVNDDGLGVWCLWHSGNCGPGWFN